MLEFAILEDLRVRDWLGGVEPVWPLLGAANVIALQGRHVLSNGSVRIDWSLSIDDVGETVVLRHVLLMLERLAEGDGVELTATRNLNRRFVGEMLDAFDWPGYDVDMIRAVSKVVNEPDFPPLHFLRLLLLEAKYARRYGKRLKAAHRAKKLVQNGSGSVMLGELLVAAFERLNLAYFDRFPFEDWPQSDIGLVLCCLAMVGDHWQTSDQLVRQCSVPAIGVLETKRDYTTMAFEDRLLRFLEWFGLVERRGASRGGREYRKTVLHDRMLSFEVQVPDVERLLH
jgi:hypothetical protein